MERRYEVHIEGRPLVICEAPPELVVSTEGMPVMAIHSSSDLDQAIRMIRDEQYAAGICIYPQFDGSLWDLFRSRYKFVQAAGGVVEDEQQRLLVIKRLGKWDLPKGKVDAGESIEEAALREVEEECGIDELLIVRPIAITWHTYFRNGKDHLKRTDWYLMKGSSEKKLKPQIEEDIEEVRWMTRQEVDRIKGKTYPSLVKVLETWDRMQPGTDN